MHYHRNVYSVLFEILLGACRTIKFLYSTVSSLKSIVGMVAKTSPSFSSCCPCWTSASVLGCIGTGWLQLSSVMCFASYFALSRSQPADGYSLVFACRWLCSSACCWLCSSQFFSSLLQIFDVLLVRSSYACCFTSFCSPLARRLWFLTTGSLAVVPSLILTTGSLAVGSVCASSSESLCGSLQLFGSFLASPNTTTQRCATS